MAVNNVFPEFVKGQKLFITLKDGRNLEATFSRSFSSRKAILLFNVSYIPRNGKTFEQLEFRFSDIYEIASLEEETPTTINAVQSVESTIPDVPTKKQDGVLYEKVKETINNLRFINQIDANFFEMVETVEKVDCVAVTGEGSSLGRFGHLTILGLATNNAVFLVDIVNLGKQSFQAANSFLKKILQSERILKIVHNCRSLSDCLKHKYSITLRNVFDTHACHYVVVKNSSGKPPSSATFEDLVADYLHLPEGLCKDQVTDPDLWRRRPLEEGLAEAAAWRVALLRKLKPKLDDALYAPFDSLCQQYLTSLRELDDEEQARIALTQKNNYLHDDFSLDSTL